MSGASLPPPPPPPPPPHGALADATHTREHMHAITPTPYTHTVIAFHLNQFSRATNAETLVALLCRCRLATTLGWPSTGGPDLAFFCGFFFFLFLITTGVFILSSFSRHGYSFTFSSMRFDLPGNPLPTNFECPSKPFAQAPPSRIYAESLHSMFGTSSVSLSSPWPLILGLGSVAM